MLFKFSCSERSHNLVFHAQKVYSAPHRSRFCRFHVSLTNQGWFTSQTMTFYTRFGSMRDYKFKNPWIWTLCTNEPTSSSLPNYKRERWVMKHWIRTLWTKFTSSEPFLKLLFCKLYRFSKYIELVFPKTSKKSAFFMKWPL